ncbi:MAG: ribulose-phosphate 3-epimerase [Butyribacter sp.]|jgi:ribulose-phosphate 3-epimerase|uniref:ribulose-phosphate 3-epimerase n=1 Tax=Butyribacter TaxID=2822463 RepID=UPI003842260F|nr:ribulose-phosphate 3-epimerase [Clostridium sp.]MCQ5167280.1 ribulose-phosphate 3-epimerase [Roseburia hominis]
MEEKISKLAPSILSADFCKLGEQIHELEECDIELLHIDVMDGEFVPSISFGMPVIKSIRKITDMFFDVHLMVNEPVRYVEDFAKCGADLLTVHYEACKDVRATLEKIKEAGMKCSVAISPDTEVSKLEGLLDIVDVVLVMSVYPGFGGQKFIRDSLEKVRKLDKIRKESKFDFLIEIDGGVNIENAKEIAENGVDWIVAGTAVFGGDIKENIRKLKGEF